MKYLSLLLPVSLALTACSSVDNKKNIESKSDSVYIEYSDSHHEHQRENKNFDTIVKINTLRRQDKISTEEKSVFKNITEVIQDKRSYPWVNINSRDSSASLSLHFNLNTISMIKIQLLKTIFMLQF